jgi:hypothetical protein
MSIASIKNHENDKSIPTYALMQGTGMIFLLPYPTLSRFSSISYNITNE